MLKGLLKNTLISAVAFFAVSMLGIVLVPFLIRAYGVEGFGVIGLVRLFIPLMGFGIFDLGFTEISTQATARARATGDWAEGSALLGLTLRIAIGLGTIIGLVLWLASYQLAHWFSVQIGFQADFLHAIWITAALLPLLFASLVFEGVTKGFENFKMQRSIEVISAVAYASLAVVAVWVSASLQWVCFAFLSGQICRALLSFGQSVSLLNNVGARFGRSNHEAWLEFKKRSPSLTFSKVLSTLQTNSPNLLIGLLLSPAAVGIYDALTRIPRFAKAVVGLVNATVQPLAVRLDHSDNPSDLTKLVSLGSLLLGAVVLPFYASAIVFSEPLLRLWLVARFEAYWPWQAMLFVPPALMALAGFGASALLNRVNVVKSFNKIAIVQIVIQLGVALILLSRLDQFSFVVGQLISGVVVFVLQMHQISRHAEVPTKVYLKLCRVLVFLTLAALFTIPLAHNVNSLMALVFFGTAWALLGVLVSATLILSAEQKKRALGILIHRNQKI